MRRPVLLALTPACLLATAAGASAASEEGVNPAVAGRPPDPDAPPNAAPHRLPSDIWLRALVRDLAARTTTVANPPAPPGSFDTGAGAPAPTPGPLCSLAPPAW